MDKSFLYYLGLLTQLGLTVVVAIFLSLWVGIFLDNKFGSKGIFTIISLIFGTIGGFKAAYELIKHTDGDNKK